MPILQKLNSLLTGSNPHMDCINCPKTYKKTYDNLCKTYTVATREIPNPVEPTMKEEPKKGL